MEKQAKQFQNAIDFLLWSYFNLTVGDGSDAQEVLDVCIRKAYGDATQQHAYNALIAKDDNQLKAISEAAKNESFKYLEGEINALLTTDKETSFDEWHKKVCHQLKSKYAKVSVSSTVLFSYGNAQKWVNMTMKYMYTLYWIYHEFSPQCGFCKEYGRRIEGYAPCFHVPVDSFIIEKLWEKPEACLPVQEGANRHNSYKRPSDHVKPWSTWEEGHYKLFQESLRSHGNEILDGEIQLDWEGPAWIEIAKIRKEREKKQ